MGFRELVADGGSQPAEDLHAVLDGSPGLQPQGWKGLLGLGNDPHHLLQTLPPALVFAVVDDAVALFRSGAADGPRGF